MGIHNVMFLIRFKQIVKPMQLSNSSNEQRVSLANQNIFFMPGFKQQSPGDNKSAKKKVGWMGYPMGFVI